MFSYRSNGLWKNSVLCHLAVSALIFLPIASLVIWVALDTHELIIYLISASSILIIALYLFKRAQTKIRFPEVEVSSVHLVLNRPLRKRSVYNLKEIEAPRFILGVLYFRHLGWPVIEPFAMPKAKQAELLKILAAG